MLLTKSTQIIIETTSPIQIINNYNIQYPLNILLNKSIIINEFHKLLVHQKTALYIIYRNSKVNLILKSRCVRQFQNKLKLTALMTNIHGFILNDNVIKWAFSIGLNNTHIKKISYTKLDYNFNKEYNRISLMELRVDVLRWRIGFINTLYHRCTNHSHIFTVVKKSPYSIQVTQSKISTIHFNRQPTYGLKADLTLFKTIKLDILNRLCNKRFNVTGVGYVDFDYLTGLRFIKTLPMNNQVTFPKSIHLSSQLWYK